MPRKNNFNKKKFEKNNNDSEGNQSISKTNSLQIIADVITASNCFAYTFLVELSKSETLKTLVSVTIKSSTEILSDKKKGLEKFIRHPFWLVFVLLAKSIRNTIIGTLIANCMPFYSTILLNSIMVLGNYSLMKTIQF